MERVGFEVEGELNTALRYGLLNRVYTTAGRRGVRLIRAAPIASGSRPPVSPLAPAVPGV